VVRVVVRVNVRSPLILPFSHKGRRNFIESTVQEAVLSDESESV
jgi:hypothetical protein